MAACVFDFAIVHKIGRVCRYSAGWFTAARALGEGSDDWARRLKPRQAQHVKIGRVAAALQERWCMAVHTVSFCSVTVYIITCTHVTRGSDVPFRSSI
jgi:hypothetical protein